MGIIHSLSADLINQIAAGEVIESTHSILKELIENSIDAAATKIEIATDSAGFGRILVSDNGHGIQKEDLPLAIKRYATSKIQDFHDLEHLFTFGFRGEALASIASVSRMVLESGTSGNRTAYRVTVEEGKVVEENYLDQSTTGSTTVQLGPDEYFVMGDNRGESYDSRKFGPIQKSSIVGRTWVRGFPFNRITLFHTPSYNL